MPENQAPIAGYFIRIPEDAVLRLQAFMASIGAEFDPVNNLTACHRELFLDATWTGEYGPEIQDAVNDYYETPSDLRIETPFANMTPAQQWALLMFATLHCEWDVDYDRRGLEYASMDELKKLRERIPEIFAR